MIRIVTDSTCDLPEELLRKYNVRLAPINIQFGHETYEEGVTIDKTAFYSKIDEMGIIPTTSQPSAGRFAEIYRELAPEAEAIISIHVTGKLSGTYQSAQLAKEMVADEVAVYPFDSLGGSGGLGFMVLESARAIEAGRTVPQIIQRLEEMRSRINIYLALADLRYAQMSGRVGRLKAALASLLNVKAIVGLEDGLLDVRESVRTRKKALDRLMGLTEEAIGTTDPVNLAVIHAEAPDEAQTLLDRARQHFNCQESFVDDLAISLAVHFGPGTVGLISYRV